MENKPIKVIFFDMAGVLVTEGFTIGIRQYEYLHSLPAGQLYAAIHDHSYWRDFSLGKISEEEYFTSVKENFVGQLDIKELREIMFDCFLPNQALLDYASELSDRYILGIISNNPKEWFDYFFKLWSLAGIFKIKAVSGYLHVRKPDPEIFKQALKIANVSPAEAVYVDDREEMTRAAKELGLKIVIYQEMTQLKKDFKKFSII
jgi:putative hydrolase of the HAD superfamily